MKKTNQLVILANNLEGFTTEVPVPAIVRLNLTEREIPAKMVPLLRVSLDLQGLTDQGEVVWLHWHVDLQRLVGRNEFWTPRDTMIYEQLKTMREMIRDHLKALGYEVRDGCYGLPKSIEPVNGIFECVYWQKDDEGNIKLLPAKGA